MSNILKSWPGKILAVIFLLGLIYILVPGPAKIEDFPALPDSTVSDLDGDTWQNQNIVAYFSDFSRKDITKFYRESLRKNFLLGAIIPPLTLNRPPEEAYRFIRDQQESTFLEEYVYPLRESLFTNGYEPAVENAMFKKPSNFIGNHIWFKQNPYVSKTTLRFYPSPVLSRLIIYLGIWAAGIALFRLFIKAVKEYG